MSNIKFAHVKLDKIIDFEKCKSNGSNFTKTFVNANKGDIPVYGASNNEHEVGYGYIKDNVVIVDKTGKETPVRYFENCLTWNIDGSTAIFLREGRFSLSEKVIPLLVFEQLHYLIDLEYLRFCISQAKEITQFGFSNKAGKSRLKEIEIPIPLNAEGIYDIEAQKSIAERYKKIEAQKSTLLSYQNKLKSVLISANFASQYKHTDVGINELFKPENGSGEYTKSYCINNRGEYPVFSGNTFDAFAQINKYDYDGDYLTWAKDGLAGYIMCLSGKFSITNHRGIMIPTDKCKNIDYEYIKYVLEPLFRNNVKGRVGHDGENEYTTLNGTMISQIKTKISIPINEDGSFDLEAQQEIAKKYRKVQQVINSISQKIDELVSIKISI